MITWQIRRFWSSYKECGRVLYQLSLIITEAEADGVFKPNLFVSLNCLIVAASRFCPWVWNKCVKRSFPWSSCESCTFSVSTLWKCLKLKVRICVIALCTDSSHSHTYQELQLCQFTHLTWLTRQAGQGRTEYSRLKGCRCNWWLWAERLQTALLFGLKEFEIY